MVFLQFLQFWHNLSAPTDQSRLQFGRPDFLTPLAPLGACQKWSETDIGHLDHCDIIVAIWVKIKGLKLCYLVVLHRY